MPWFCKSSRKKAKAKVGGVTISKDDSLIGNGKPLLAVLLQNFTATAQDELTVQRGQIIELFYSDGGWRYIRNVDGKCGYVPNAFCYPLDQMVNGGVGQWNGNENEVVRYPKFQSRPRTLHLDELLLQGATEFPEDGNESPSPGNSNGDRVAAESVHQATPPSSSTPPGRVTCTPAQEAEIIRWRENVTTSSDSRESTPRHNSTPRIVENSNASLSGLSRTNGSGSHAFLHHKDTDDTPRRTSTPVRDETPSLPTPFSVTPQPPSCRSDSETERNQPSSPCCRRHSITSRRETSSQEDNLNAEEKEEATDELSELRTLLDQRHEEAAVPTPIPITVTAASPQYDRLDGYRSEVDATCTNVPNDIISDAKKPQGIYRCAEAYEAHFEGQVSLRRNELVIVLEFGHGEWAWVFTSTSSEGLVPKAVLEKYQPGLWMAAEGCVDQLSIGTQTELIVSSSVRRLCVSSSGSATCASSNSVRVSPNPPQSRASHGQMGERNAEMASIGVQTEFVSPEWFKNNASPRHEESAQQPRTPPRLDLHLQSKRLNSTLPNSPTSLAGSPMPVSRSKPRFVSLNALGDHGQHLQRCRRRLARSESEPGCDTHSPLTATPLVRKLQPQTPILTAVRDYQPPVNGKNCLSLRKGDIIYQQSHVPYPNGWMWVYHSLHRSFGYVPKSHVAYMYMVQRKPRAQSPLLEAEV